MKAEAQYNKYRTLFQVVQTDENGDPVTEPSKAIDPTTGVSTGRMMTQHIDAPEVEDIPDFMHRHVTEFCLDKLTLDGCVNFRDLKKKFGVMADSARMDYVRRWIEGWTLRNQPEFELIPVTQKFWTNGTAAKPKDVSVADGYIVKGRRTAGGWVSTLAENGQHVVRASLTQRAKIVVGQAKAISSEAAKSADGFDKVRSAADMAAAAISGVAYEKIEGEAS